MRKILLLAIPIFGYSLWVFSQFNTSRKPLKSLDSIHFNWGVNGPANDNSFLSPIQVNKEMNYSRGLLGVVEPTKPESNMPCLKPRGFFPMQISKPDSTVKYTLLIKKTK